MVRTFLIISTAFLLSACSSTLVSSPSAPSSTATPQFELSASTLGGEAQLEVDFYTSATGFDSNVLSYTWSVNAESVERYASSLGLVFYEAGSFEVTVRVTDGVTSLQDSVTISVKDEYRPAGSPDIVVMGFAGRCFVNCLAPRGNKDYLSDASHGTLKTIRARFNSLGFTAQTYSYRSNLLSHSRYGEGYLKADEDLQYIRDNWIRNYKNPTRIVLVGHSHGNQFMSLLAFDHPEITFDYAIYLDAICQQWDADHLGRSNGVLHNRFAEHYGYQARYPYPLNKYEYACDSYPVPGLVRQDISDVVPDNVIYGLEVWSSGVNPCGTLLTPACVYDKDLNHRRNGSSGPTVQLGGIFERSEAHGEIYRAGSLGLGWILDVIEDLGFPSRSLTTQSNNFKLPPPPEGFERLP